MSTETQEVQEIEQTPEAEQETEQVEEQEESKEETEESEGEEEKPEEETEEAEEEAEDEKSDTKAEKRINQLTARLKQTEEKYKEAREEIAFYEQKINQQLTQVENTLPDFSGIKFDGKPLDLYALNDQDYSRLCKLIRQHDISADEKIQYLESLEDARNTFLEKTSHIRSKAQEVEGQAGELWKTEWDIVDKEFFKEFADLKDDRPKLAAAIAERLNDPKNGFDVELCKASMTAKFKYALKVANEEGLITKAEKKQLEEERANLATTSGKGKSGGKTQSKVFTRTDLSKMSLEDFKKYEKEIDAQMESGKIK